eukprot:11228333-Lingulodinium_polyedra.AAC.1
MHGSLAAFRKWHPEFGTASLVSRALIHQFMRVISPETSRAEKQAARLVRQIKALQAKEPEKRAGTAQVMADIVAELKAEAGEEAQKNWTAEHIRKVCKRSQLVWSCLSVHEHAQALAKARSAAITKKEFYQGQLEALEAKHRSLMDKLAEEQAFIPPVMMSACQLGTNFLDLFHRLATSKDFKQDMNQQGWRQQALECPRPLSLERRKALADIPVWQPTDPPMPGWHPAMARNRDYFSGCVLGIQKADGQKEYYKYLYSVQSPGYLALSPCQLIIQDKSAGRYGPPSLQETIDSRHLFKVNFAALCSGECLKDIPLEAVTVISDTVMLGGTWARSGCIEEPLATVLGWLPGADTPARQENDEPPRKQRKKDEDTKEQLLVDFPWLLELDEKEGLGSKGPKAAGS